VKEKQRPSAFGVRWQNDQQRTVLERCAKNHSRCRIPIACDSQFFSDGTLATISGPSLQVWGMRARSKLGDHTIPEGGSPVLAADGRTLVLARDDRQLVLWRKGTGVVRSWNSGNVQDNSKELWHWRPPSIAAIDAALAIPRPR